MNREPRDSSSVLEALPGNLDIRRHSHSILYIFEIITRRHSPSILYNYYQLDKDKEALFNVAYFKQAT